MSRPMKEALLEPVWCCLFAPTVDGLQSVTAVMLQHNHVEVSEASRVRIGGLVERPPSSLAWAQADGRPP